MAANSEGGPVSATPRTAARAAISPGDRGSRKPASREIPVPVRVHAFPYGDIFIDGKQIAHDRRTWTPPLPRGDTPFVFASRAAASRRSVNQYRPGSDRQPGPGAADQFPSGAEACLHLPIRLRAAGRHGVGRRQGRRRILHYLPAAGQHRARSDDNTTRYAQGRSRFASAATAIRMCMPPSRSPRVRSRMWRLR